MVAFLVLEETNVLMQAKGEREIRREVEGEENWWYHRTSEKVTEVCHPSDKFVLPFAILGIQISGEMARNF